MSKKILYVITILIIVIINLCINVKSYAIEVDENEAEIIYEIKTENEDIKHGDKIAINLSLKSTKEDLIKMNSFSTQIKFNKNQLEICKDESNIEKIIPGDISENFNYKMGDSKVKYDNDYGIISIAMALPAEKGINPNGKIARIEFNVISSEIEKLDIQIQKNNENEHEFSLTTVNIENNKQITNEDVKFNLKNTLNDQIINKTKTESNSLQNEINISNNVNAEEVKSPTRLPYAGKSEIILYILVTIFIILIILAYKIKLLRMLVLIVVLLSKPIYNFAIEEKKLTNELLLKLVDSVDINKLNYLSNIEITEEQYNEIKNFTTELIENDTTEYDKMKTIFEWIGKNIKVQNASNKPYDVFKEKKAVCQGFANLFVVMMDSIKIPSILVQGDTYFGAHAWAMTYINDKWILTDPTNGIIRETVEQYDENYTKLYFTPYYIHIPFSEDEYIYSYNHGIALVDSTIKSNTLIVNESYKNFSITTLCFESIKDNIENVIIGKNVEYIQYNTNYANNLKSINVDSENKKYAAYKNILYNKNYTKIEYIPRKIEEIEIKGINNLEKETIKGLNNVKTINLEEGVEKISSYAIELENAKEIYLPKTLKEIEQNAIQIKSDFIVNVYKDTYAHEYVIKNKLNHKIIDEYKIVSEESAKYIIEKYNKNAITEKDVIQYDINKDKKLNATDAAIILDKI